MVSMSILNLRDAVLSEQNRNHDGGKVQDFIDGLDEETRQQLDELMLDSSIQTRALWKTLKENGLTASETTFRIFRKERLSAGE